MSQASRLIAATLLCALAASLAAQQPLSLADADVRGQNIFEQSGVTGMVLVVVRGHETMIRTYGQTFPGSGRTPDSNSEIRLCSVSKILTTDLLARLVAEGKVKLDDPLQSYAPTGKFVPLYAAGQPITLRDLATHTAGLPREVSSYPPKTPHFTFPNYTYRWNWLPKQKLKSPPGTAAAYSNIGFDLLGDALASASGNSYAHLLRENLIEPLHMWDTTLAPSPDQCSRLLRGSRDEGPCTDTQPSGPSGGVYSTPADMTRFLQYVLHIPGSPAQPAGALDVYLRPRQLKSMEGLNHAGDATGIGLAWIQLGDPASPSMVMEKTGGGAGFGTYIALSPQRQTGIFLAITEGKGGSEISLYHEANTLLADLANVPPLPPKVHNVRPAKHPSKAHSARPAKHAPKSNPQKTKPRSRHPAPTHPASKRRHK